jgi:hypothetical protein
VQEMDAYGFRINSLFLVLNSLFFKTLSLLIRVGNYSRSGCGMAVSCYEIGPGSPQIAKFPVKFPVSREFAWRLVRSALRRQPGSLATGDVALSKVRNARQWRAFADRLSVSGLQNRPLWERNR